MELSDEAIERIAEAYHDAVQASRGRQIEAYLSLGKPVPEKMGVAPCEWIPAVARAVMAEMDTP